MLNTLKKIVLLLPAHSTYTFKTDIWSYVAKGHNLNTDATLQGYSHMSVLTNKVGYYYLE